MRFFRVALAATLAAVASASTYQQAVVPQSPMAMNATSDRARIAAATSVLLFVGTYTRDEGWVNGQGKGVHVFQFNTNDGSLQAVGAQAFGSNPTFVSGLNNADRRVIYAVNEVGDPSQLKPGTTTGFVYALTVDATGKLTQLNRVESGGGSPAHVSVSPDGKFVTASNYNGGSVSIYPVNADGSLAPASDFRQYPRGQRDASHMHSMTWVGKGSDGVLGADLGNDRIAQFNVNAQTGKLVNNPQREFIDRPFGSGPRHMAIHPTQKFAYVVDELKNTIGVYTLTASSGSLSTTALQSISTLPAGFTGQSSSADIHVSEDGNYLYSSNRGHDSIAMFKIGTNGQLTNIGYEPSRGRKPRSFRLYNGYMLVANQDTNEIQVFRVDAATGKLVYANQSVSCGTPVSLFIPGY